MINISRRSNDRAIPRKFYCLSSMSKDMQSYVPILSLYSPVVIANRTFREELTCTNVYNPTGITYYLAVAVSSELR